MQVARIVDNLVLEVLDTSRPDLFPDFVPVPDHVYTGMDTRYFDDEFNPLPDAVLIERGLKQPDPESEPDPEPETLTHEQQVARIDQARRLAYADPLTGSDPLFAQYQRMVIMQEPDHEAVKAQAIARYDEIRAQYPWPPEPAL